MLRDFIEKIRESVWIAGEIIKEISPALFPTPKKEKEAFLEEVRSKVDYYQPQIESKCKIRLGDISVKDGKHLFSEIFSGLAYESAFEKATNNGRIPTKKDFNSSFREYSIIELITYLPLRIKISFDGTQYVTGLNENTIYVPFTFSTRLTDILDERLDLLDTSVVHEISHVLWKRILDKPSIKIKNNTEMMWQEGFANYCAEEYFQEFYPRGVDNSNSWTLPPIYQEGQKKVEKVIEKRGIESLLEIPKRWKEFEKDLI